MVLRLIGAANGNFSRVENCRFKKFANFSPRSSTGLSFGRSNTCCNCCLGTLFLSEEIILRYAKITNRARLNRWYIRELTFCIFCKELNIVRLEQWHGYQSLKCQLDTGKFLTPLVLEHETHR